MVLLGVTVGALSCSGGFLSSSLEDFDSSSGNQGSGPRYHSSLPRCLRVAERMALLYFRLLTSGDLQDLQASFPSAEPPTHASLKEASQPAR